MIRPTATSSPKCCDYLRERRDALVAAGIPRERICLDPGIGFGKTHEHNITLMRHCHEFHALGCPLLVGHSRKGFLGKLIGDKEADRTNATVGATLALAVQGVQIVRVHDVRNPRSARRLRSHRRSQIAQPSRLGMLPIFTPKTPDRRRLGHLAAGKANIDPSPDIADT